MKEKITLTLMSILSLVGALFLFIHHFLICGRWFDIEDFLHHEILELILIEAGIFFAYLAIKTPSAIKKASCWVFNHWVTVLRYIFFLIGYWQLDVLVGMLGLEKQRDKWFYFLRGRLTYWDAYVLFSITMGIGFFIPDIIKIIRKIYKWVNTKRQ